MFIDLIMCKEYFSDLGFNKVLTINPMHFSTRRELEKKLDRQEGLKVVMGSAHNRLVVEVKKIDLLLSPEKGVKKDALHHRNSGLNHVICKLAQKNKIAIGFNFNDVLRSKGITRAEVLGRMMQNVRLCRKYGLRMVIGSFAQDKWQMRAKNDLISFGIVLGMHQEEARKALQMIDYILEEKKEKRQRLGEGIRIFNPN